MDGFLQLRRIVEVSQMMMDSVIICVIMCIKPICSHECIPLMQEEKLQI